MLIVLKKSFEVNRGEFSQAHHISQPAHTVTHSIPSCLLLLVLFSRVNLSTRALAPLSSIQGLVQQSHLYPERLIFVFLLERPISIQMYFYCAYLCFFFERERECTRSGEGQRKKERGRLHAECGAPSHDHEIKT